MEKTGFMKWFCAFSAALLCARTPVFAESDGMRVTLDGADYPGEVRLMEDTAYVALREFCKAADTCVIEWNADGHFADVTTADLNLTASPDSRILEANGRMLWCPNGIFEDGGTLYVPLRQLSEAFGFSCTYLPDEHCAALTRMQPAIPAPEYGEDAVYWLSKIIEAESGGESFSGKLAVGSVILNRVASDEFPDTIYGVIFDTQNGVQFTPTANGMIWGDPGEDSIRAAMVCLENPTLSPDALYFINADLATNLWVPQTCTYLFSIGCHDFYK